ncbi:MAG: hypothetical protein ACR2N6_03465 [Miltoncostaeaceae bacterium]
MNSLEIVVLGSPGERREELSSTIRTIGHTPVPTDSEFAGTGDVLLVDLDTSPTEATLQDAELDSRPMLVVAGRVSSELRRLMARPGDTMLVTDPSEGGLRTALATASGLVARHRAAPGRALAWMAAAS